MTATWGLTVDCSSPGRLAAFWAEALGYREAPPPEGFASRREWLVALEVPEEEWDDGAYLVDPEGRSPGLSFLRVPEARVDKNRLHLDLQVSGGRAVPAPTRAERIEATRARLEVAGATVLARHEQGGRLDHLVLADPEGNEFCVV
ncbi:VOC family protein [Auraticoccus monumenti]|uniref:Glyoxalase-like domain-containing protein n=1 Tax=Auraticoccus monumenti TaxID=675864 RepID=A0A1G7EN44_9ACTN|nr:VOC family protein [Auraticoccus monumenti]SDE65049.1 hypothetical protein SAMN04489747_3995 [Auraticoccus monumenti]